MKVRAHGPRHHHTGFFSLIVIFCLFIFWQNIRSLVNEKSLPSAIDVQLAIPTFPIEEPSTFELDESFKVNASDKFLVYASHSGFSNQLVGLARAAVLAKISDRVLVIPPVLSHKAVSFGGSKRCNTLGQKRVVQLANKAYRGPTEGSFNSLFDFDAEKVYNVSGLKIVFWEDFWKLGFRIGGSDWKLDFSRLTCGLEKSSVQEIRRNLKKWDGYRVLNIGSAFMSRVQRFTSQEANEEKRKMYEFLLDYFTVGVPVRKEISEVASRMLNASFTNPDDILSVHIRTGDMNENAVPIIKDTIRAIDQECSKSNHHHVEVFFATDLADGTKNSLLRNFVSRYSKVLDLRSIEQLEGNGLIDSTAEKLRISRDLLSIVLDQHICANARHFYSGATEYSTFTGLIYLKRKKL
jgi:hypothetical protein